jgi:hypothetical protein
MVEDALAERLTLERLRALKPAVVFEAPEDTPTSELARRTVAALPPESVRHATRTVGPERECWTFNTLGESRAVTYCPGDGVFLGGL